MKNIPFGILAAILVALVSACATGPLVTPSQLAAANAGPTPGPDAKEKIVSLLVSMRRVERTASATFSTPVKEALTNGTSVDYGWSVSAVVDGKPWSFFFCNGCIDSYLAPEDAAKSMWRPAKVAERIMAQVTRDRDDYRKVDTFWGPASLEGYSAFGFFYNFIDSSFWKMRGWSAGDECQIYVRYGSSSWAFLESAHDHDGNAMKVIQIDRNVHNGGSISEDIAIVVPAAYLAEHRHDGIDLRIDGQRGWVKINVPGYYVDGFLLAIESPAANSATLSSK